MTNVANPNRVHAGIPTGGEYSSHDRTEAAFALAFADEVNAWDHQETANDAATPPFILHSLVELDDWLLSTWVAKNPSTSSETLNILTNSPDNSIRQLTAGHLNTAPDDLYELTGDIIRDVRISAASNPNLPQIGQTGIARDESDRGVQLALATNPGASPETLTLLAVSRFEIVRVAVANR